METNQQFGHPSFGGNRGRLKSMYKFELAEAAGVSCRTFNRWLHRHDDKLLTFGINHKAKLIPPKVVRWICNEYGIDVEPCSK